MSEMRPIFVSPSTFSAVVKTFCNSSLLEALSARTYAPTSEYNDIKTMVGYAERVLNDENKLNEMKEKAFLRAQKFDINKIIYNYEDIYKSVI